MKIIDCFPFFNEEEHLILRINLLKDYVDSFVICEANRTHTGVPKEYVVENILRKNNLLLDKVHIHKVELPSTEEEPNDCTRERKQRNDISQQIKEDEGWFISDCDEIINPEHIKYYAEVATKNPDNILKVRMTFHECDLKYQVYSSNNTPLYWDSPFFVLKHHLKKYTLSELREDSTPIEFSSILTTQDGRIVEGGWHLSWMGSPQRRVKKLQSFMHYNDFATEGIGDLSTEESKSFIEKYKPKEGSFDVLNRKDHILKKYDTSKLPSLFFTNKKLKKFFKL